MKKILAMIAVALGLAIATPAAARDKVYHTADALPAAAQQTLKKNFPKAAVNRVKVDSNMFGAKDYEVVLSNGAEIEFKKDGEWKEVDCGHSAVPAGFVPNAIRNYINKNHQGGVIVKIEKDSNDYEVELADGTDLKFDRAGKFLRYD